MNRVATDGHRARRSARSVGLWAGILVPPAAWGVQLLVSDLLFELGCAPGAEGRGPFGLSLEAWTLGVTAVAAGATLVAGILAFRAWRGYGDADGTTWGERARTMGWWGLVSVGLYGALIVYGAFPPLLLEACVPSL